jgi:hypothetical protein
MAPLSRDLTAGDALHDAARCARCVGRRRPALAIGGTGVGVRRADAGRAAVDGPADERLVRGGRVAHRCAQVQPKATPIQAGRRRPSRPLVLALELPRLSPSSLPEPCCSSPACATRVFPYHRRDLRVFQSSSQVVQPFRQWLWPTAGNNLGTIHALRRFVGEIPNQ